MYETDTHGPRGRGRLDAAEELDDASKTVRVLTVMRADEY